MVFFGHAARLLGLSAWHPPVPDPIWNAKLREEGGAPYLFGRARIRMAHHRDPLPPMQDVRKDLSTLRTLLPYLWPKDSLNLRMRVVIAIVLLVAAKLVTVTVPVFYKHAVDALSPGAGAVLAVPIALLFGYGLARILAQGFGELRNAVFARVEQRAVRLEVVQHVKLAGLHHGRGY